MLRLAKGYGMTLEQLNEHLYWRTAYREAHDRLDAIQAVILGAQQYDGMPHGYDPGRKTENLALLLDQQLADLNMMEEKLEETEKPVRDFVSGIEDNYTKVVFNLRYLCGLSWEKVAKAVGGGNSVSAVKMCCYRYLGVKEGE